MAQIISDTEMAGILTDMADSQVPALSAIIEVAKRPRDYGSPVTETLDAEPAPKKHKADEETKYICPYGLQYRPKPHIRFDREFHFALDQISHRAHVELLALMIKQQKKNLAADNQAIKAQQQLLENLYPKQHSFQASRSQL